MNRLWAENAELPSTIRKYLPVAAQTKYRLTANRFLSKGYSAGFARSAGWAAVKKNWEQTSAGTWVRKSTAWTRADIEKVAEPRTLYVRRDVLNAKELIAWAKGQGFKTTVTPEQMHVTIAYSRRPVDWMRIGSEISYAPTASTGKPGELWVPAGGPRLVEPLGDSGAVVLMFSNDSLSYRNQYIQDKGASWDYEGYQPHITITYDRGQLDLSKVKPFAGEIRLGPEIFEEVNEGYKDTLVEKGLRNLHSKATPTQFTLFKVNKSLGLVFGWAMICKKDGKDYYDLNVDSDSGKRVPEHITESAMLNSSVEFMENSRVAKDMHKGEAQGTVVFAFPLTTDIAKAMGLNTATTGLMVAIKPRSKELLEKFASGEYTGFSIGGKRVTVEEVE